MRKENKKWYRTAHKKHVFMVLSLSKNWNKQRFLCLALGALHTSMQESWITRRFPNETRSHIFFVSFLLTSNSLISFFSALRYWVKEKVIFFSSSKRCLTIPFLVFRSLAAAKPLCLLLSWRRSRKKRSACMFWVGRKALEGFFYCW